MKRAAAAGAALALALLVQLTLVNGLRLPGGGAPDLVLLTVSAIGLVGGERPGLAAGFCAGLALDLAPPASGPAGPWTLVLSLARYWCGRMAFTARRSSLLALAVAAVAAATGEAASAGLALALGSPGTGPAALAGALPWSVFDDLAVGPLVLLAAVRVGALLGVPLGRDDDSPARAPADGAAPSGLEAAWPAGPGRRYGWLPAIAAGGWIAGGAPGNAVRPGEVGWLSGPAASRRARRRRARTAAALAGVAPRGRRVRVGGRPGAGWAARAAFAGIGGAAGAWSSAAAPGAERHGPDGHGLRGPGVPRIAFRPGPGGPLGRGVTGVAGPGGGGDLSPRRGRRVPRIAFGAAATSPILRKAGRSARVAPGGAGPGGRRAPRIAFGPGRPGSLPARLVRRCRAPRTGAGSRGLAAALARPARGIRPAAPRPADQPGAACGTALPRHLRPVRGRSLAGRLRCPRRRLGRAGPRPWRAGQAAAVPVRRRAGAGPAGEPAAGRGAALPPPAVAAVVATARRPVRGVADRRKEDESTAMIPASRRRLVALCLAIAALFATLAVRVWYLQVRSGSQYVALATSERVREVIEPAVRGPIVDDTGQPIVASRPALVISVSLPALWAQPGGGAAVLGRLAGCSTSARPRCGERCACARRRWAGRAGRARPTSPSRSPSTSRRASRFRLWRISGSIPA